MTVVVLVGGFISITILLLLLTALIEEEQSRFPTVQVTNPLVDREMVNGTEVFSASMRVKSFERSATYDEMPWDRMFLQIKTPGGTILAYAAKARPDDPDAYYTGSGEEEVLCWFRDVDDDGVVGSGDEIILTGMDRAFEGAHIEITWSGVFVGITTLPSEFP